MKIAILGGGNIGGNLGKLWSKSGHDVFFGSRTPGALAALVEAAGPTASAGTLQQAIDFSDLIVEALPFAASVALPAEALAGKTLVTASNFYPARDGEIDLGGASQSEALAARLPETKVVKAFNMLSFKELVARLDGGGTAAATMIMAGDDPEAKARVAILIADAGFEAVDAGPLSAGRHFQTDGPLYARILTVDEVNTHLDALKSKAS